MIFSKNESTCHYFDDSKTDIIQLFFLITFSPDNFQIVSSTIVLNDEQYRYDGSEFYSLVIVTSHKLAFYFTHWAACHNLEQFILFSKQHFDCFLVAAWVRFGLRGKYYISGWNFDLFSTSLFASNLLRNKGFGYNTYLLFWIKYFQT